ITEAARKEVGSDKPSMEKALPQAFAALKRIQGTLERHYRDMQDLEFTVEQGKLWMLQTRSGKRTAQAALRIAVDLAQEKLIDKSEAVKRIDPTALDQLLHPTIDPKAERKVIATGLPASPGAASGEIVFSPDEAEVLKSQGRKVILVRVETSPASIHRHAAGRRILEAGGGQDLAGRGGRARHGQALRFRRRLAAGRLPDPDADRRRRSSQKRRHAYHRRRDRAGPRRRSADARAGI